MTTSGRNRSISSTTLALAAFRDLKAAGFEEKSYQRSQVVVGSDDQHEWGASCRRAKDVVREHTSDIR
jgi:hypothetical protein